MQRYVLGRIVIMIPTLLLASTAIFALMRIAVGGDPVLYIIDREETAGQARLLRHELHLDRSIGAQYLDWLSRVAVGDFGRSFRFPLDVRSVLMERLPATLELAGLATALALSIAIPIGIYTATVSGGWARFAASSTTVGLCLPDFCLAMALIYVFSITLHWLPSTGYVPFHYGLLQNLSGMVLPAVSLAAWYAAVWARYVRSAFLEVRGEDYVRVARAKGLAERAVTYGHILRNAMLPTVTIVGQNVAGMLGGTVAVETVFGNPGIGRLLSDAVLGRDYPVIQGVVLLLAFVVSVSSLMVDVCYGFVDPRIRYG
jgi:peptide/nickel transport system permease protein